MTTFTYDVEIPGSGKFRVESAKELTDAQAYRHAAGQADMERMANPTTGMSTGEKFAAGAGKFVSGLGSGLQQLGATAMDYLSPRQPTVSGLVTGQPKTRLQELQQEEADTRARDSALMNTAAGKLGHFAGGVASVVPTMFIPGLNTYTGAAALGGALGALNPTVEGESRAMNTAVGAGAGVAGQALGNTVGRLLKPVQTTLPPEEARLAQEALNRGIPLTAAQRTGSRPLQIAESVMENLPMTSGPQLAQKAAQKQAYNRAVGSTFGQSADAITPDVAGAARTAIGQKFTDLSSRNTLQAGQGLIQDLGAVQAQVNRYATPDVARIVNNNIDDILSKIEPGDIIPGRAYRELDSQIGRIARNAASGDVRNYLGQVRDTLRSAMDQSISAADRGAWQEARRQYANLMTVAPLAAKSETGDISGRTLLSAANAANKNAKFGAPSELADLGRIGKAFIAEQIPNSGTAQRLAIQSLLTGGGAGVGALGAAASGGDWTKGAAMGAGVTAGGLLSPRLIQMLMNSPAGQTYLTQGLMNLGPREMALLTSAGRAGVPAGLLGYTPQQ